MPYASSSMTIALDCFGGDHAPASVLEGASLAQQRYPAARFLLFGHQSALESQLKRLPALSAVSTIIHCDHGIAADEKPSQAVRKGRASSMWRAIEAVRYGQADAVVSAGNTGALMAFSKLILKTLPGVYRPAIVGRMPTAHGECVMLDLGANVECDAHTLQQFALMGNAFARVVLEKEKPTVGLLNIGSEMSKGKEELKEAYQLLETTEALNFTGFVEAHDIGHGRIDVVVTDGFTGNVALKMAEGTAAMVRTFIKESFLSSWWSKISYVMAKSTIAKLRKRVDPRKYNGAMFVGLNGVSVKSHGSADGYSFYHALKVAIGMVESQFNDRVLAELQASGALLDVTDADEKSEELAS